MVRSYKSFFGGMAVLYAGMMLFGQGLHEFMGCEHEHGHFAAARTSSVAETGTTVSRGVDRLDSEHDPATCPLCQFYAQGQLTSSVTGGGDLRQSVTTAAPVSIPLVFEVRVPGVHGPRPPPSV